jgi:hypothetical protein
MGLLKKGFRTLLYANTSTKEILEMHMNLKNPQKVQE